MTKPAPKSPHHHGNLKSALIDAGVALLEEGGLDGLTLRKCAARAGVSHAAPAHHFDGLTGLKSAIAQDAFGRFSRHMLEAADAEGPAPIDRLRGICRGYLQFGLTHRALLEIIFGVDPEQVTNEGIDPGDSNAYMILRDTCAPFVPAGTAPEIIEFQVWSLIHGYTLLFVSGRLGNVRPQRIEDGPFEQVLALLDCIGTPPSS